MGLDMIKPVFGVSDKASFKPVFSATETFSNIEISPVASLHNGTFPKAKNKVTDQTAHPRRLVCACVVCKPPEDMFSCLKAQIMKLEAKVCAQNTG